MSSGVLLFLTTFVASAVEAVEALTIVLAVGVVRGWRSTLYGVGAAAVVLAAIVAALGPALRLIPISTLTVVFGALLLRRGWPRNGRNGCAVRAARKASRTAHRWVVNTRPSSGRRPT